MAEDYDDGKVINIYHGQVMQWFGKMMECVENLPPEERAEFDKWDRDRPEGVATSDWPGFAQYLPDRPWDRGKAPHRPQPNH
jgi:hypothetical protein